MDDDSVPASLMRSGISMGIGTGMVMDLGSGLTNLSSSGTETMKTVNIIRLYLKTEVVGLVKTKLKDIRDENIRLTKENLDLTQRISALETTLHDSEQYSRRNSLRVSKIPETPEENTDKIVLGIAKDLKVD